MTAQDERPLIQLFARLQKRELHGVYYGFSDSQVDDLWLQSGSVGLALAPLVWIKL
jgi:hypothetical protein